MTNPINFTLDFSPQHIRTNQMYVKNHLLDTLYTMVILLQKAPLCRLSKFGTEVTVYVAKLPQNDDFESRSFKADIDKYIKRDPKYKDVKQIKYKSVELRKMTNEDIRFLIEAVLPRVGFGSRALIGQDLNDFLNKLVPREDTIAYFERLPKDRDGEEEMPCIIGLPQPCYKRQLDDGGRKQFARHNDYIAKSDPIKMAKEERSTFQRKNLSASSFRSDQPMEMFSSFPAEACRLYSCLAHAATRGQIGGGQDRTKSKCGKNFAISLNAALRMHILDVDDLQFGCLAQQMHRLSHINSSVESVKKGLYFDLTALRMMLQLGCVQPSVLKGVPVLQVQDHAPPHGVNGYVVFELIKQLPAYTEKKYGLARDIAHDLIEQITLNAKPPRAHIVKQLRILFMGLRTRVTKDSFRPDDLPEGNLFMTCSFLEVDAVGPGGEQVAVWTLKNECGDGRLFTDFLRDV